jgi:hypothetical protein
MTNRTRRTVLACAALLGAIAANVRPSRADAQMNPCPPNSYVCSDVCSGDPLSDGCNPFCNAEDCELAGTVWSGYTYTIICLGT